MPKRIQRKRTKGWRMPEGVVYVGRPSKFGNPWQVGNGYIAADIVALYHRWMEGSYTSTMLPPKPDVRELRGKDLACWCPLDQPCHADVLLELANAPEKLARSAENGASGWPRNDDREPAGPVAPPVDHDIARFNDEGCPHD